jgi:hypothetical protein
VGARDLERRRQVGGMAREHDAVGRDPVRAGVGGVERLGERVEADLALEAVAQVLDEAAGGRHGRESVAAPGARGLGGMGQYATAPRQSGARSASARTACSKPASSSLR